MLLGRPAVAIDLPGHGHTSWRDDHDYSPVTNAATMSEAGIVDRKHLLVGMSLGGMTSIRFAATHPDLVSRLVVVDTTPGSLNRRHELTEKDRGQVALIAGPSTFDSFDDMLAATVAAVPAGRPLDRVRRGVLNNAQELPDGRWGWRYDQVRGGSSISGPEASAALWADAESLTMPVLMVQGGDSKFVHPDHVAEFAERCADFQHIVIPNANHAVQSDQPHELARVIAEFSAPLWTS
jgi:pimeloyl-ACP methyl ester carboxylesterase